MINNIRHVLIHYSIKFYQKQQTQLQQKFEDLSKQQQNKQVEAQNKLSEMSAKQQHDLNIVEQLKTIVSDKEMKVKVLESEIQQLKLAVSTVKTLYDVTF